MKPFGTTKQGKEVDAITLRAHGLSVTILTYGAIVQDVRLDGVAHSLAVGSNDLADYEGAMQYFGAVIAPVVNRIGNATAIVNGQMHTFEPNLHGRHTLHSGTTGAHKYVWHIDEINEVSAVLSHNMPHGRGGFPANRQITAHFEILAGPALRLTLTTTTDAPSIANATNHSYWNLDGTADFTGHQITIAADNFLPIDPIDSVVTGEIHPVDATDFDFSTPKTLTPQNPALDHTFCVAKTRRALTECATLTGASGLKMTVSTTEPGLHIYDARDTGHHAIAIEAQGYPDAPNNPHFPSIAIAPDTPAVQITQWKFTRTDTKTDGP